MVDASTTPVIVVTGVAADAMAATTIGLQWDLPSVVAVNHRIDVEHHRLSRTVSDVGGVVEHAEIDLEHACVSCAIREDIIPTLERLAASGRWASIIAQLPVGAEARQVGRVAAFDREQAPHIRIGAVVAAVDGMRTVDDLLGDDLLYERGWHTSAEDRRGVAEVCAGMVEYADVVSVIGDTGAAELDLLRVLVRPGALIVPDGTAVDSTRLVAGIHDHDATESWVADIRQHPRPGVDSDHVWTVELTSDRPFHPDRLRTSIGRIGGGRRRSRGCFWLPSRPGVACAWDGAGGQLSIGIAGGWGRTEPLTRIVVTGMDDGRDDVEAAFEHCLLSEDETRWRGRYWEVADDGFETWLGQIRRTA